jgi:hypothetical protein
MKTRSGTTTTMTTTNSATGSVFSAIANDRWDNDQHCCFDKDNKKVDQDDDDDNNEERHWERKKKDCENKQGNHWDD